MLQAIITLLCLGQGILALPHPDHHPTVVYDADEHRLYFDFPPEIFIGNADKTELCPADAQHTAPCKCGDSLKCNVGEACNLQQGPVPSTCIPAPPPPACEIALSHPGQLKITGQLCTCGSTVCSADQICDGMTNACLNPAPCPAAVFPGATPCKCGLGNEFCLGMATQCTATDMCV